MTPERSDYDEPGGRAWDGWPVEVGFAAAVVCMAVVAVAVGVWHFGRNDPATAGFVSFLVGVPAAIAAIVLRLEYRDRREAEAAIIANDARGH